MFIIKVIKNEARLTWKCKMIVQIRPSVSFGLPGKVVNLSGSLIIMEAFMDYVTFGYAIHKLF